MDLSVVKKEQVSKNEASPNSQPVDLTTGPKHAPANESSAVDLSFGSGHSEGSKFQGDEDDNADKLEASRSLLRAALQAKQDAKSQHPKLMQLLGDSNQVNKPLESLVSQAELRAPFSPLLMAAQMNMAFPHTSLPGGIPQFPGAPTLFGSPFSFPLKRKMSSEGMSQLSPMAGEEKPLKPAKRRKSMNHGYDSDGSKSPSQHSDTGMSATHDANFPSRVEGKRYICGLCSASFTFQTNLTRHQRKLHGKPYVRKPVGGSLTTFPQTTVESTTPTSSPQAPVTYEVPPTPPIFGPVLGIKSE